MYRWALHILTSRSYTLVYTSTHWYTYHWGYIGFTSCN